MCEIEFVYRLSAGRDHASWGEFNRADYIAIVFQCE